MSPGFDPNPGDPIVLFEQEYVVQPHPQAPYLPYRQKAGRARVYQLQNEQLGQYFALKEFKKLYRTPDLIDSYRNLHLVEDFEGLRAAKRRIVLPDDPAAQRHPNLQYAMLMPWIHGRTWFDVLGQAREDGDYPDLSIAIRLCDRFLKVVEGLEADEMAHTDISPGNVIVEFDPIEVQLVDLEDIYMPGVAAPLQQTTGALGYQHRSGETTWKPQGDRYAAAVLAAEMLILANPDLARRATDEGFFTGHWEEPEGMVRFEEARPWLEEVAPEFAKVFDHCWFADSLEGCPRISELREPIKQLANRRLLTESPKRVETPISRQETPISRQPSAGTTQLLSWADRLAELYAQARWLLTGQPLSLEERLTELYAQARRLHRAQEWQAVVGIFDQIHALDPAYSDPEGLLTSAREELAAQELERRVAATYDQGQQHMDTEEWQQALECFEEVQRLKSGYQETERLLSQVRHELLDGITPSNIDRIQLLRTIDGHTNWVSSVEFSPDGRLLASGSEDKTVRLWQVEDGELLRTLEGHTEAVGSVVFSPDGRLLASGSQDETVRLWRVEDGELLRTLEGHLGAILSVAFSSDGRLLASAGNYSDTLQRRLGRAGDGAVCLWRVEDGALLRGTLLGRERRNPSLSLRDNMRRTSLGYSTAFSSDGRLLAYSSADKTVVRLWQVNNGELLRELQGGWYLSAVRYGMAFSSDGRLLASSAYDNMVRLWRVEDGTLLHTLEGYSHAVDSIAFSPDGRLLSLGSSDKTVRLWQVEDATWLRTLEGHTDWVSSVAFSPDGQLLASGGGDNTVRLWGIA